MTRPGDALRLQPGRVAILGHRGCALPARENTLEAVLAAFDAGADGVELDVRRTGDGVLVCAHDAVVDGLELVTSSYADVLAAGAAVGHLETLLDAARGRGSVVCEIKNIPGEPDFDAPQEATAGMLATLLAARADDDVLVSSFDWFAIEALHDRFPTAFLVWPGIAASAGVTYVLDKGHRQVHAPVDALLAEPAAIEAAHQGGVGVVAWTVETVDQALALDELGVDGLICDHPDQVVAALRG